MCKRVVLDNNYVMMIQQFVFEIQQFVFEMQCGRNKFDYRILALSKQQLERLDNSNLNGDTNPDLCNVGAVLKQ